MKQLFFFVIAIMLLATSQAQSVTQDAKGNYIAVKKSASTDTASKSTGKTFTDAKGNVYPVMVSTRGRLYVVRTSAKGNQYKQYLKL